MQLEVNEYDLMILDLNLPYLDGLDVLREIRKTNRAIKILILSARTEIEDRVLGLDLGANDYLIKPFDFLELEARIRTLLRWHFIQQPSVLECGGIILDTTAKTVWLSGQLVSLTKKEYAILEYLMAQKGKVISAEELIEHVWDSEVDLFSNSLKYHIHSLKKKLRKQGRPRGNHSESPRTRLYHGGRHMKIKRKQLSLRWRITLLMGSDDFAGGLDSYVMSMYNAQNQMVSLVNDPMFLWETTIVPDLEYAEEEIHISVKNVSEGEDEVGTTPSASSVEAYPMSMSTQTAVVDHFQRGFNVWSLVIMGVVAVLGMGMTYWISGQALKPVRALNQAIQTNFGT